MVVDAEQMPPPMAPVWSLLPFSMTPPISHPWAASIGPTAARKLNCWPGATIWPLRRFAGRLMLTPLPLVTPGKKTVVQWPMMTRPLRLSGVTLGEMGAVTMATVEPRVPAGGQAIQVGLDGLRSRGHVDAGAVLADL